MLDGCAIVHLEGSANIDSAVQIHKIFIEAFETHLPVTIDTSKVTACDYSFIQLLTSLCFSLSNEGKSLKYDLETESQVIVESLIMLGYRSRCKCVRINNQECPLASFAKNSDQEMES